MSNKKQPSIKIVPTNFINDYRFFVSHVITPLELICTSFRLEIACNIAVIKLQLFELLAYEGLHFYIKDFFPIFKSTSS